MPCRFSSFLFSLGVVSRKNKFPTHTISHFDDASLMDLVFLSQLTRVVHVVPTCGRANFTNVCICILRVICRVTESCTSLCGFRKGPVKGISLVIILVRSSPCQALEWPYKAEEATTQKDFRNTEVGCVLRRQGGLSRHKEGERTMRVWTYRSALTRLLPLIQSTSLIDCI